jgi:ribosome maturation factor RimP
MREDSRRGAPRHPPAAAPGTARLTRLIEPVLRAMDMDLEAVRIASAGRRRVLRVIVDTDGGVSLDQIAEVSREISVRLDAADAMGDAPYTLEVSSPGVDRPLTLPRHWRRAAGRLVSVPITGQDHDQERQASTSLADTRARVISADLDGVLLDIDGTRRTVGYRELGPGRVEVEFGHLDDVQDVDEVSGHRELGDFEQSWDGPDEEGPDGH